jgi:predicted ATPase
MFRAIFRDVLVEIDGAHDVSHPSGSTTHSQSNSEKDTSDVSSQHSIASAALEKFSYLVNELNAPPEFIELVGHHILGFRGKTDNAAFKAVKSGTQDMIIDFIARAFRLCTSHADLVLLVLDDVHWLDELSWKVIQALFKEGQKLLIICATRPLKSYSLEIDSVFWAELHDYYTRELRFSNMYLVGLDEDNIRALISKKLGIQKSAIDRDFFVDIHARSGGMPHFASQMLETIKRGDLVTKLETGKLGWREDLYKKQVSDTSYLCICNVSLKI